MQTILASFLLCSVALGGAVPARRQSPTDPTMLAVYSDGSDGLRLGSVLAGSGGSAATVTTGNGDLFYVEGSKLKGPVDGTGGEGSHAFIAFPHGFAGCEYLSGKLTFSASNSNKCASSGPFSALNGVVQYTPTLIRDFSSFQVCDPDQHTRVSSLPSRSPGTPMAPRPAAARTSRSSSRRRPRLPPRVRPSRPRQTFRPLSPSLQAPSRSRSRPPATWRPPHPSLLLRARALGSERSAERSVEWIYAFFTATLTFT
ncbi:hypothetical protein PsYK624_105670 [Phanerochaete sordida]|uniref:Uncharacterized protein n=1 Tax=Phanerochaete sordida TaxID=48140 RepID=A0A9P3GE45_9APHY|nr:hypothetical protein PsYK624_105670 [Phanerochaete sordida]